MTRLTELKRGGLRDGRIARSISALMLILAGCAEEQDPRSQQPTNRSSAEAFTDSPWTKHPLVFVGVDGASWKVIDAMIEAGDLPNFEAFKKEGAYGTLISFLPSSSPVLWTTMATGRYPRHHNVLDFTYPYLSSGPRSLLKSTIRRTPAIWNLASECDRVVAVLGYYVTDPVDVVNGWMMSDQFFNGGSQGAYPEEMHEPLKKLAADIREPQERSALLKRFLKWDYDPKVASQPDHPLYLPTQVVHRRVDNQILNDEMVRRATRIAFENKPDFLISYYRIVDNSSHAAWQFYESRDFDEKPTARDVDLLGELIPEAYRYIDECIGEIRAAYGNSANIVIVSDHGFGSATGRYRIVSEENRWLSGNHRMAGVVMASGPDIKPGVVEGMTVMDVAPTLLALLGVPLSEQLAGRPELNLFTAKFIAEANPRSVSDYSEISWTRSVASELDTEQQDRGLDVLIALGYISGKETEAAAASSLEGKDVWTTERSIRLQVIGGEIAHLLLRRDSAKLAAMGDLLRKMMPDEMKEIVLAASNHAAGIACDIGRCELSLKPVKQVTPLQQEVGLAMFEQYLQCDVDALRQSLARVLKEDPEFGDDGALSVLQYNLREFLDKLLLGNAIEEPRRSN